MEALAAGSVEAGLGQVEVEFGMQLAKELLELVTDVREVVAGIEISVERAAILDLAPVLVVVGDHR